MIAFSFEAQGRTDSGEIKPFRAEVSAPMMEESGVWVCKAEIRCGNSFLRSSVWPEEAYHMLCEAVREWCRERRLKLTDGEGCPRKFLPPLSFPPFRQSGTVRFADGTTQPLLVAVGIPYRINLRPGSEFACSVYGFGGEVGPLLGDTPDTVYAAAFRLLRRSLTEYGVDFLGETGTAMPIQAPVET